MKYTSHIVVVFTFASLLILSSWVLFSYVQQHNFYSLFSFGDVHFSEQTTQLLFVGDVMLGRNVERLSREFGAQYPYARMEKVSEDTFLVGNFESAIPKKHVPTPNGSFTFSVDPVFLPQLYAYGFDAVSLANNHSYDHGVEGFENAVEALSAEKFVVFGNQINQGSSTIAYHSVNGTVVALVGVYAVNVRPTDAELKQVLSRAETNSDLQIVYVHWGEEYALSHNSFQEELAQVCIDAGADVVVGHHPHVVQDIGLYKGVPIFYSLGNFIFDQYFSIDVQEGLSLGLVPKKDTLLFTLHPVSSVGYKSQPARMASAQSEQFLKNVAKRSDPALTEMITKGLLELAK
jgi:poly-gamma-glutamate synthesis protein (capsule biosynthesis protein)